MLCQKPNHLVIEVNFIHLIAHTLACTMKADEGCAIGHEHV